MSYDTNPHKDFARDLLTASKAIHAATQKAAPMSPAPNATHPATGRYYVTTDGYYESWMIVCPDGTKYGTHTYLGDRSVPEAEADRLTAIRAAFARYTDALNNPYDYDQSIELNELVTVIAADQPVPEPVADTLPPGPVVCSCGSDSWQEVASIIGTSDISWGGEKYEYDGDSESYWDCSDFIRWECRSCGEGATPEQSAAISNRLAS